MKVTVTMPEVPTGLAANLIGLAGFVALTVAAGGLTGNWWWSLAVGGAFAIVLAVLVQRAEPAEPAAPPLAPTTAPPERDTAAPPVDEWAREQAYMRGEKPATS